MGFTLKASTIVAGHDSVTTSGINTTNAKVIVVSLSHTSNAATISDTVGGVTPANTWIQLPSIAIPPASAPLTTGYYCLNPVVGTGHTFTLTGASTFAAVCVEAWDIDGVGTLSILPLTTTNALAAPTSISPGAILPTVSPALLVTFMGSRFTATTSIDGGFTISNQSALVTGTNYAGAMAHLAQTTAASANPSWSFGGSAFDTGVIMVCFGRLPPPFIFQPSFV